MVLAVVRDDAAQVDLGTLLLRPDDMARDYALWHPRAAYFGRFDYLGPYLIFDYPPAEDIYEIASTMNHDPLLRSLGLVSAEPGLLGCPAVLLPAAPGYLPLTEYYNELLDYYFLSPSREDNATISSGLAGPGWRPTGEVLYTSSQTCFGPTGRVFRFYSPQRNTHVFTASPAECGRMRQMKPEWTFEGIAFAASPTCGHYTSQPVYRLARETGTGAMKYRFAIKPGVRGEMVAKGWTDEGVAFCLPPQP